ncbi:MAG: hypothetical protein ACYDEP_08765 [Acidimicrobiales bacterium]
MTGAQEYWENRDVFDMTGAGVTGEDDYWENLRLFDTTGCDRPYFDAHDGELWSILFFLNARVNERFESDEMDLDNWMELRRDSRFDEYLRAACR